jgi:hypothetical protein
LLLVLLGHPGQAADAPPLTIADLNGYREALSGKPSNPPIAVGFRELWARPQSYQGKAVQVEGRLVRVFEQGSFGAFPALTEAWAVSPSGDPFCLVYPTPKDRPEKRTGMHVRFAGTFLRILRYEGTDGGRLAPLIVGSHVPVAFTRIAAPTQPRSRWSLDWTVAGGAAVVVVAVLLMRHLRKPAPSMLDPDVNLSPPAFVDQEPRTDGGNVAENA